MKTLTQYRDDLKALKESLGRIDAKVVAENREPAKEEISLKNEIMDSMDELRQIIQTMEREEVMSAAMSGASMRPITHGAGPGDNPNPIPKKDQFKSFGEQLMAVVSAERSHKIDPRLYNIRAASGLNETVPSEGGFLVQQDFTQELLRQTFETGILARRCRQQPISGIANSIKINGIDENSRVSSRYGGILGAWVEEGGLKSETKPKFRKIELNLKKLAGLCYATDELLEDAAALEAFIREAFPGEFGFLLDDAIINGTGAGMPLGILPSGCLVSVSKETGQTAATIMAENIVKMYSRMFASSLPRAEWFINQNVQPQLFTMSLSVGTGGIPVYMPAGGLSGQPFGTLFGRPVIPIEQCATLGTVGDIIFADMGGYILATKGGIKADMSIHVRFAYDESVFRFVMRVDGQPMRASALTPYKGGAGATQSHFIALETRS